MKKYKLIIIDSAVDVLGNEFCQDLLSKIFYLKVRGFKIPESKYLALDQNDFFATHFALCEEINDKYTPVMSIKMMSEDSALRWGLPFPGKLTIEKTGSLTHIKAIQLFFENY